MAGLEQVYVMEKKDGAKAEDRIAKSAERIEKIKKAGRDTSQLEVILRKIQAAHASGNVKEKNLLEAISKLEGLLQVTEKLSSSPEPSKDKKKRSDAKKKTPKEEKKDERTEEDDIERKNEMLERLKSELVSYGGDLSPIHLHLEALDKAMDSRDRTTYRRYFDVVKPWLHEYLFNLKRSRMNERIEAIRSSISEMEKWGRMDLVGPIKGELEPLIPLAERAGDDIDMVLSDLDNISEMAYSASIELDGDLRGRVLSKQKEIKDILSGSEEGLDPSEAEGDIEGTNGMMEERRFEEAIEVLDRRIKSMMLEANKEQVEARDRYLKLLDPLFAKVVELQGAESDVHKGLLEKRKSIDSIPLANIDEALVQLEALLDEAARASAEAEEGAIRAIRNRVSEMGSELLDMDEEHKTKLNNLFMAINESLIEADLQSASITLKEAEAEFDRLIRKKSRSIMESHIKEMRENLRSLRDRGADVMPIEEMLASAQEHLMHNEDGTAAERLSKARNMFTGLLESTLKADHQLLSERIRAEIDSPDMPPIPRETLLERLDNSKLLFEAGDLPEAVTILRETEEEIRSSKMSSVLNEKMDELEGLIREASAFGLDVREMAQSVSDARTLNERGDLEGALQVVSTSKVGIEAMIRERNLRKLEADIETIVMELRRLNAAPDDHKETIARSYSLLEADRIDEAIKELTELKANLKRKLDRRRTEVMIDTMSARIREARAFGLDMSSFKAALTKAGVRFEIGDLDGAMKDLITNLESLEALINERKLYRSRMDRLRGSLISIEGKVQRLSQRNVDTSHLKEDIVRLKGLIETGDEPASKELYERLDGEITRLFRMVPVGSISEPNAHTNNFPDSRSRSSIEAKSAPVQQEELDPFEARKRLQLLLTRIGRAVQMRGGIDVHDEIKAELEGIKALIVEKRYNEAYVIAMECMKKLGG
ncbi:MAG: hypothetical protein QCI82_07990 [Candidatus Thermoplasmatota archaeon]|nr:hypothetical protein [Candidatus Thermoplasmatota archaeon]